MEAGIIKPRMRLGNLPNAMLGGSDSYSPSKALKRVYPQDLPPEISGHSHPSGHISSMLLTNSLVVGSQRLKKRPACAIKLCGAFGFLIMIFSSATYRMLLSSTLPEISTAYERRQGLTRRCRNFGASFEAIYLQASTLARPRQRTASYPNPQ